MILDSFIIKNSTETVRLSKLTVFVGPNNCGKSQTLKDIASLMNDKIQSRIVSDLNFPTTNFSSVSPLIVATDHPTALDHKIIVGIGDNFAEIEHVATNQDFESSKSDSAKMFKYYNKFRVVLLNALNRASVINQTGTAGLENDRASNLLQLAYLDDSKEILEKFQTIFRDVFSVSVYLDHTALSQIALRISEEEITSLTGDTQKDRVSLKALEKIDDQGEGYKSFAATILGLVSAKNRLVLLDEPEVFLHNAQQKQLGRWVGDFVKDNDTQLIIATHSSNFLEGLLASGVEVDIQRLNRIKNCTNFSGIDADTVKKFTADPILSSQRVLDALFQKAVVVCEADTDRMIYKMVADKIKPSHEILFIHSHNKQTTPMIVETLKKCTVPVYSILDIDIFHEDKEYNNILAAHDTIIEEKYTKTQIEVKDFVNGKKNEGDLRLELKDKLNSLILAINDGIDVLTLKAEVGRLNKLFSNWHQFKKVGIDFISDVDLKRKLVELLEYLKENNLYIVGVGELEGWIPGDHAKGKRWINHAVAEINKQVPEPLNSFINEIVVKVN